MSVQCWEIVCFIQVEMQDMFQKAWWWRGYSVGKLRGWVLSYSMAQLFGGSGLYGMVQPLPTNTAVARGTNRAELVHVCKL
eukprot:scaffold97846_cov21-Tisochrysis_lutea.AAC.1